MAKAGVYLINRVDQIEAFGSPVKREILLFVSAAGPCSVPEIAEAIGRSVTSLYRHVHQLAAVGLLVDAGTAKTIRRDKQLYKTPARHLRLAYERDNPKVIEALCKAINAHTRAVGRSITRAFRLGRGEIQGRGRNMYYSSEKGWVSESQLAKVNEHIEAINNLLYAEKQPDSAELLTVTVAMWSNRSEGETDDE